MAYLIVGDTIGAAWLAAVEYLHANGREREEFDLVVAIADAAPGCSRRTRRAASLQP